jgi:hypothetical protein
LFPVVDEIDTISPVGYPWAGILIVVPVSVYELAEPPYMIPVDTAVTAELDTSGLKRSAVLDELNVA